jgi:hypothetical protein
MSKELLIKLIGASILCLLITGLFLIPGIAEEQKRTAAPPPSDPEKRWPNISREGRMCAACHLQISPSFVQEWEQSSHAKSGVDCFTCHRADRTDPDAFAHEGQTISILVTPRDCGQCHALQLKEMSASRHAEAGDILNSLDNYLGETVAGPEALAAGCFQCHGSRIKVLPNYRLDPSTWPNTGIGRLNPDGSKGSCSACHTRHRFSRAQARRPEACGKCHVGPAYAQREVYEQSKHGILYAAFKDRLNIDSEQWVVGREYTSAPTCASCHMGATLNQPVTHDVGTRISWTLRPPVSEKLPEWEKKREAMIDVCGSCHARPFITGFYKQFDDLVGLYNDKFAKPATAIRNELMSLGKLSKTDFDDKLDWTYWELWHQEGRRARQGASMSGPNYAWWEGMYDVSKNFYNEFLPEVKRVAGPVLYDQLVRKYLASDARHEWYFKGMSRDRQEKIRSYYEQRYNQQVQ